MYHRITPLVLLISLIFVCHMGCDDTGYDNPPERIASLSPGNTEILYALGLADSIVAVTEDSDYPPEAQWKPSVGSSSEIDIKLLIELEPDLALVAEIHAGTVSDTLEENDIRVLKIAPKTIDDVSMFISLIGVLTSRGEEASIINLQIENQIDSIISRINSTPTVIEPLVGRPRVCCVTNYDPIYAIGQDTLIHNMVTRAGGNNIFANATGHFRTDLEVIVESDPEIIMVVSRNDDMGHSTLEWFLMNDMLRNTMAGMNNRIYEIDARLVTRPGPRIADGFEEITKAIHPELDWNTEMNPDNI